MDVLQMKIATKVLGVVALALWLWLCSAAVIIVPYENLFCSIGEKSLKPCCVRFERGALWWCVSWQMRGSRQSCALNDRDIRAHNCRGEVNSTHVQEELKD